MEKGNIVEIRIDDMSHEGKGVGKYDGLAVFADGAVIGDTVKAEITKVKKNYAFARTQEIIEKSPDRIEPVCRFAGECGGCVYSELEYPVQGKIKRKQVYDKLERIGGIAEPVVRDMVIMDEPYGYRNKAEFPVKNGKVGFFRRKSHDVLDIEECMIQSEPANAIAKAVRSVDNSRIKHIVVRTAFGTGEVMAVLVTDTQNIDNLEEIIYAMDEAINELPGEFFSLESVYINEREKKDKRHMGDKFICVAGKSTIIEDTGKLKFEISPASFYQVNPVQMEKLYGKAIEYMNLTGEETVLDIYCGVGTIGIYASDKAKKVIGIEAVKDAVIDANRNAVINHIVNARYLTGKAEEVLPKLLSGEYEDQGIECRKADVAVIDPPRTGCDEKLLNALAEASPDRIVYVSCDPATLARDIKILTGKGYSFVETTPFDMFPWTAGIECVVSLSKVKTE